MIKICADSSADLLDIDGVSFCSAPLKIITDGREFVDDSHLDISDMLSYLEGYKGRSSTACPSAGEWMRAFDGADEVVAVTITSGLSGSYNSACCAAREYERANGSGEVFVIDSLSVGPESALIIDKLASLVKSKLPFEKIKSEINAYRERTRLIFALESMHNLANNGRVSHLTAKMAGILGIRAIGRASDVGTLEMTDKVRGAVGTARRIVENMIREGYDGGRVLIHHVKNLPVARLITNTITDIYPKADIVVREARGLCSFYAEQGGVLAGFEV